MAEFTLAVKNRENARKNLYTSRAQGLIPAIMYGHGTTPSMFWVQALGFSKLYTQAGENSIIEIAPEIGKPISVIINAVQIDPLSNRFTHIDFFQVRMDEKLEAHIPLEFFGEAPAIRELGGVLVKPVEEILVSCLPKDLPHAFRVNLSALKTFEQHIQIKDIGIPAGVTVLADPETTIALVEAPRTEAEIAALDEKVETDVTQVEGVVKDTAATEAGETKNTDKKSAEEKK